MKKLITVSAVAVLAALVANAQEVPKYEAFFGYAYIRANEFNQNTFNPVTGTGIKVNAFSMNGGDGQFIYNFSHPNWISIVADAGGAYKPNVGGVNAKTTVAWTLVGPRYTYRGWGQWVPYGELLLGAAYRTASRTVTAVTTPDTPAVPVVGPLKDLFPGPNQLITARVTDTQSNFSLAAGGGLDFHYNKWLSFRLASCEYVMTRFPSLATGNNITQNNLRATAGVIFTFGSAQ